MKITENDWSCYTCDYLGFPGEDEKFEPCCPQCGTADGDGFGMAMNDPRYLQVEDNIILDANSMTPAELRALAYEKESAAEETVVKVGYLKMDLYISQTLDGGGGDFRFCDSWGDFWLKTTEELDKIVVAFKNSFKIVLKKGTKFNCYHYENVNHWFDDENYGVTEMDDTWAEKYLENITEI